MIFDKLWNTSSKFKKKIHNTSENFLRQQSWTYGCVIEEIMWTFPMEAHRSFITRDENKQDGNKTHNSFI